ncbi:MAG: P1 family peptidase [Actinomycetota bacterium]|nr:P1 family peptidase [Actinomycetota bacterium]
MAGIDGLRIGHWSDSRALTGCTVFLPPPGTMGAVWVAGGAPATRETDLLRPGTLVQEVHGVVLTGGSAFGLAAADGAVRYLEEHGRGLDVGVARVPIVPAAALFDLWVGDASRRPDAAAGYAACENAVEGAPGEGNAGAGVGATVGKHAGPAAAMKGGFGWAEEASDDGVVVAAAAVVNAFGDVLGEDGRVLAGARAAPTGEPPWTPPSTTLLCVVTNADLTKEQAFRVGVMAGSGLARAVRPVNTMFDGDAVFVLATRTHQARIDDVGSRAANVVSAAIRRGVLAADSIENVPACSSPDGVPYAAD